MANSFSMWLYLHWNIVSLNLFKIVFIPSSLWSSVCFLKLTRITDSCYNSAQAAVRQRSGTMFPLQQHSRGKSREIQFVFTQQLVCKGKPTLLTFRFTLNQRRNKMTFFQATRKRDVFIVSLWTKASIPETFFFFFLQNSLFMSAADSSTCELFFKNFKTMIGFNVLFNCISEVRR